MSLAEICKWVNDAPLSTTIRESDLLFPIIETVHVLAITALAGTVAIVDLRLLGVILKKEKVTAVAGQLLPLTWVGLFLMFSSGFLLFLAEASKSYSNPAFRVKMLLLVLAGLNPAIFHSTVYRGVSAWDESAAPPWRARLAGALSLVLWSSIIVAGRAIAYF